MKGADGFSVKERIMAVDHRNDRQGGIGPGVGRSFPQARHPGMRAERFDLPGPKCPARHNSPMSGPEGRKERFCTPWNTSRYRFASQRCLLSSAGMAWKEKGSLGKSCGPRRCQQIRDCFRRVIVPRRLPYVNSIARIVPSAGKKKRKIQPPKYCVIFIIGAFSRNLICQQENTTFL